MDCWTFGNNPSIEQITNVEGTNCDEICDRDLARNVTSPPRRFQFVRFTSKSTPVVSSRAAPLASRAWRLASRFHLFGCLVETRVMTCAASPWFTAPSSLIFFLPFFLARWLSPPTSLIYRERSQPGSRKSLGLFSLACAALLDLWLVGGRTLAVHLYPHSSLPQT